MVAFFLASSRFCCFLADPGSKRNRLPLALHLRFIIICSERARRTATHICKAATHQPRVAMALLSAFTHCFVSSALLMAWGQESRL